jgi:hypothetical protein
LLTLPLLGGIKSIVHSNIPWSAAASKLPLSSQTKGNPAEIPVAVWPDWHFGVQVSPVDFNEQEL